MNTLETYNALLAVVNGPHATPQIVDVGGDHLDVLVQDLVAERGGPRVVLEKLRLLHLRIEEDGLLDMTGRADSLDCELLVSAIEDLEGFVQ